MRTSPLVPVGFVFLIFAALGAAHAATAEATFFNAEGQKVGTATLTESAHGVLIQGRLDNMPAGLHAFHIHTVGECSPDFMAAGGHYNPHGKNHGILNPEGKHAGDLPNLFVAQDGRSRFEFLVADILFRGGSAELFDADGSSFIVHAGPDDHVEGPTTGPDRIACAVIEER